jgi:hypothetical protein
MALSVLMLQRPSLGKPGEDHCGYEHHGGNIEGSIQGAGLVFNGTAQPSHEEAETPTDEHKHEGKKLQSTDQVWQKSHRPL